MLETPYPAIAMRLTPNLLVVLALLVPGSAALAQGAEPGRPAAQRPNAQRPAAGERQPARPGEAEGRPGKGRAEAERPAGPADEAIAEEEQELRVLSAVRRIVEEENHHDERLKELLVLRRESLRHGQDHRVESLEILLEREIVRHEEFLARGRAEMGDEAFEEAMEEAHELLSAAPEAVVDRIQEGKSAALRAAAQNRDLAQTNEKLRERMAEAAAQPGAGAGLTDAERRKALREKYVQEGKPVNPKAKTGLRRRGGQGGKP